MKFPPALAALIFCTSTLLAADDIKTFTLYPEKISLRGSDDSRQLLVTAEMKDDEER